MNRKMLLQRLLRGSLNVSFSDTMARRASPRPPLILSLSKDPASLRPHQLATEPGPPGWQSPAHGSARVLAAVALGLEQVGLAGRLRPLLLQLHGQGSGDYRSGAAAGQGEHRLQPCGCVGCGLGQAVREADLRVPFQCVAGVEAGRVHLMLTCQELLAEVWKKRRVRG